MAFVRETWDSMSGSLTVTDDDDDEVCGGCEAMLAIGLCERVWLFGFGAEVVQQSSSRFGTGGLSLSLRCGSCQDKLIMLVVVNRMINRENQGSWSKLSCRAGMYLYMCA